MEKGKLIWWEGGEGSGKSTFLQIYEDYLSKKGIPFETAREPGGTLLADKVRDLLLDKKNENINYWTEFLLFETSRSQLYSELIIPKLEKGISIGQDRSGDSTITYQGYGRGIDLDLIRRLNRESTFGIKPDLVFIIDIDPIIGLKKECEHNRMSSAELDFFKRVRKGYLEIAKQNPKNYVVIPYLEDEIEEMENLMKPYVNKLFNLF